MRDCRASQRILLVEGEDDLHVVLQLWCRLVLEAGIQSECDPEFCISEKGGIDRLLESIASEVQVEGRRAVGIVVDADEDPAGRWESVADQLREVGIEIPEGPRPGGVCIEGGSRLPRVGVWLMPDNTATGELEDFIETMLPDTDPVWPSSRAYIDGIKPAHRKFKERKALRAKVYAWLATRKQPGRMGAAIKEGDLEIDGELAVGFAGWLRHLFDGADAL